jgi:glycosyltransferase involved in cell wall biosynthesis
MKNNEQVDQEQSTIIKLSDENARLKSELADLSAQHKKLEINLEKWKDSEAGLKQEYIQTLSNSWERLFNSRFWRLISLTDVKKRLPSIILPNGEAFDENYYLETYPDVKATGIPAVVHYLCHGIQEGRLGVPKSISQASRDYAGEKQVLAGGLLHEPTEPFNADFYRAMYPVLASLADPERHFLDHGRVEGLLGRIPLIALSRPIESLPIDKPTILLVSHEASRTGAPILSLNIVQQLTSKFNVVTLLLRGGPLEESFIETGAIVAGPVDLYHKETFANWVLGKFLDTYSFQFAIVNSVESHIVLKPLADRYIPTISLIHEFAVYIRPRTRIQNALLWSSQTVFSTDITLNSAIQVLPELASCKLPVLAQGKSIVPGEAHDPAHIEAEKAMLQKIMRPDGPEDDTIVILGAGWVQIRKGVDLFIECATRVINSPIGHKCRFVWIGNNYNPEKDTDYSIYLQDQIQRAGISERFKIISETAAIEHVYALSDMMLLTARLDPLPNVAIDAMVLGLPVLCFDNTTGVADILKRNGLQEECVAPYLDTHKMADKIIQLASSKDARDKVGEQARSLAAREFNMPRYVEQLLALTEGNAALSRQEQVDAAAIQQAEVVDLDYYPPAGVQLSGATEAIRRYVRSWTRGVLRRKLFPGFDPLVYKDMNASVIGAQDPLAHFLSAGHPEGPWNWQNLSWKDHSSTSTDSKSLIFISLRSADSIEQIVKLLVKKSAQIDVVILVPDELAALTIKQCLQKEQYSVLSILVSEDQPLLAIFKHLASVPYLDYTAIAHINLSTDPIDIDFSDRETYQQYLIENMIGGKYDALGVIAGLLSSDSSDTALGLVFPEDPNIHDATADAEIISSLCQSLGFEAPASYHLPYPVNGSFWGAPTILNTLLANADGWKSTLKSLKLTAVEQEQILARLLAEACRNDGKHIFTTVVPGITY